jgi:endonuclease YncB( thermonuclease family)
MTSIRQSTFILAILFAGVSIGSLLEKNYGYIFADAPPPRGISTTAVVEEWYDGDTATVTLSLQCKIRMLDCWAPEVRGSERLLGLKSKEHIQKLVPEGSTVRLFIPTTGRLQDSLTFGRALGSMWIENDDGTFTNVSDQMVKDGFATKDKVRR